MVGLLFFNFDFHLSCYLEEIVKIYGTDILADNAVFKLAQIYDKLLGDEIKAKDYYKKILFDYKGSLFGVEARKRFREIGGTSNDTINKESPFIVEPHFDTP